jgi:hypothetical protein
LVEIGFGRSKRINIGGQTIVEGIEGLSLRSYKEIMTSKNRGLISRSDFQVIERGRVSSNTKPPCPAYWGVAPRSARLCRAFEEASYGSRDMKTDRAMRYLEIYFRIR